LSAAKAKTDDARERPIETALPNQNIENNPMHSSHAVDGIIVFGYPENG
jgi:hypothetical protein